MIRTAVIIFFLAGLLASCGPTKKIQTAIAKKDTVAIIPPPVDTGHDDSLAFIKEQFRGIKEKHIGFKTFSAKIDVDFRDAEGKKSSVTAHVRMAKDSLIWVLINGPLGIEGVRALITADSVKVLNKQDKTYSARSVSYLQEVTELPLDLHSLQNLLIGNPVFLDSNIISYQKDDDAVSLLSIGSFFKNLFTIAQADKTMQSSKLDDLDELRNRTCYLTYLDYEDKKGVMFSKERNINVAEKKKLDINLKFKQYEFNETLSFPFNVSEKYKRN